MNKIEIFGHTLGAVYGKKYYTEVEYNKLLEKEDRKSKKIAKKIKKLDIVPRLRQMKVEFFRTHILVNVYRMKDFEFKAAVSTFKISYRDIDRAEIRVLGNRNPDKYYKDFKIRFYNELNEEIFYLNFGSNNEFYSYQESLKGYQLLMAHLNINNIEYDVYDETYFR